MLAGCFLRFVLMANCQLLYHCCACSDNIFPMTECFFCKIIAGKIPAKKVYEDEKAFAFEDIKPQAPTHVLIIPKKHIVGIDQATEADAELVGYCQLVAAKIARERKLEHGFRTVYNVGPDAGQTVFHLHLHLLGGRQMHWPPG
jgi:histidine triad (HIT) family protein